MLGYYQHIDLCLVYYRIVIGFNYSLTMECCFVIEASISPIISLGIVVQAN